MTSVGVIVTGQQQNLCKENSLVKNKLHGMYTRAGFLSFYSHSIAFKHGREVRLSTIGLPNGLHVPSNKISNSTLHTEDLWLFQSHKNDVFALVWTLKKLSC